MTTFAKQYLVPFDKSFSVSAAPTSPNDSVAFGKAAKRALKAQVKRIALLQDRLYAADSHAVLLVFQAMDAAGKDSTIKAVTSGVNPAGFQVSSFKKPSKEELDHDFLWRTTKGLPERGRIGIFNRSHYEETLVTRVHPEYLLSQRLPLNSKNIWAERFESIRGYEQHLARNGTVILKFWLNVSRAEQLSRFERRLQRPDKNWKFSPQDMLESERWSDYMHAYEEMLNETSTPWAPWFAIPADDKPHMRLVVAEIIADTMAELALKYPSLPPSEQARVPEYLEMIKAARIKEEKLSSSV